MKKYMSVIIILGLTLACSAIPSGLSTPTPTVFLTATSTPTPTPTSTPTITPLPPIETPSEPDSGFANLYGRVLWQGNPVPNFKMSLYGLTDNDGFYSDSVQTDNNGRFLFTAVPPGNDLTLQGIIDEDDFDEPVSANKVKVNATADTIINYGEYSLISASLLLLSPERDSTIQDPQPSLIWAPFPGAAYYHLSLKQGLGAYTDLELDTTETEVALSAPLMACSYGWDVTAYNANGTMIARSDLAYVDDEFDFTQKYDGFFIVKNETLPSCKISVVSPKGKLTGTGTFEFKWELHPLATKYHISVWRMRNGKGEIDLDASYFYGTYHLKDDGTLDGPKPPTFAAGQYRWEVHAFMDEGSAIAESGWVTFSIH